ncbi:hypothetical protein BZA70DRAFT_184968 [Myxozyma melibiosi]|uniref:DNA repair and recombination protein RAD52 n=1 Tax=Myxozyma melibiosi TaxID=54550 RepID=A0ABR1F4M2_9ASCO
MPAEGDQHAMWAPPHPNTLMARTRGWSSNEARSIQERLNQELGPEYVSQRPGAGGGRVHYLEGWKVLNLANEVFGFNGWSSEIKSISVDHREQNKDGRCSLVMSVTIRVTLKDGTFHEDVGSGHVENVRQWHAAFDKCRKEATTDALKRCFRAFGPLLGNCLYDNEFVRQITKVQNPPRRQIDMEKLHRAPEYRSETQTEAGRRHAMTLVSGGTNDETPNSRHTSGPGDYTTPGHNRAYPSYQEYDQSSHNGDRKVLTNGNTRPPANQQQPEPRPAVRQTPHLPIAPPPKVQRPATNPGARLDDGFDMEFGSDLIADYNEIEEYDMISDDVLDYEPFDGGELVTYTNNEDEARNGRPSESKPVNSNHTSAQQPNPAARTASNPQNQAQRISDNGNHVRAQSGPDATAAMNGHQARARTASVPPDNALNLNRASAYDTAMEKIPQSTPPFAVPNNQSAQDAHTGDPGAGATSADGVPRSAIETPVPSPCFFSARAAEAVQKEIAVDNSALFDVSFQSPSMRKTIDHSRSRPVARSQVEGSPIANLSPRIDNPRLNPMRRVGMPPTGGAPGATRSLLSVKRPLHSSNPKSTEPLGEISESNANIMNNAPAEVKDEANKKQKV